jgi:Polyphosphate kinase 2 (PPK2)
LEQLNKNWKFSVSDIREREYWGDYMDAYEQLIQHTSHAHAPWFVVPADHKWFTRLVVAAAVIDALQDMHPAFPQVDADKRKELQAVREILEREGRPGKKKSYAPSLTAKAESSADLC